MEDAAYELVVEDAASTDGASDIMGAGSRSTRRETAACSAPLANI